MSDVVRQVRDAIISSLQEHAESAAIEAYREGYRNGFVDATVTEDGYPDEAEVLKRVSEVNLCEGWDAYRDTFIATLRAQSESKQS